MEYVEFYFKQVRALQDIVKMPGTGRAFREEQVQVAILRLHCVLEGINTETEPQVFPRVWTGGE